MSFFTMSPQEAESAKQFCETLKKNGFDAELKKAKDKPSIVVDLTTSNPTIEELKTPKVSSAYSIQQTFMPPSSIEGSSTIQPLVNQTQVHSEIPEEEKKANDGNNNYAMMGPKG